MKQLNLLDNIEYKKSLNEVDVIIESLPKELSDKIPNEFKQMIKIEKEKNYFPNVNDLVIKNNLRMEAKVILGMIYRDFLIDKEKKVKLRKEEESLQREFENEKIKKEENLQIKIQNEKEKNDINKILQETNLKPEMNLTIKKNEKWYIKILKKIFKFRS